MTDIAKKLVRYWELMGSREILPIGRWNRITKSITTAMIKLILKEKR